MTTIKAMQVHDATPHQFSVPGRHEATALTDCCPRTDCLDPTKPAAVLDLIKHGRNTGRVAAYRCRICDAAWLCWWAPPNRR